MAIRTRNVPAYSSLELDTVIRILPILCLILMIVGFGTKLPKACAQGPDGGTKIYKQNAESVFLLLAKSESGDFVAQGSGFLIEGQRIITNAHVANAGKIYLVLGSAKIPTKLESIDTYHDLAILGTDVELTSLALPLAKQKVNPGDIVYAIGNPEGLEKTISQGLVSGLREIDGRELIQVTAPISHGSSGGPVFNSNGEVMGVAVGFMSNGQNLNFAVPVSILRKLLENGHLTVSTNALSTLEEVQRVQAAQRQDTYSADDNSTWQTHQRQINKLLTQAVAEAGVDVKTLTHIAQVSLSENLDVSIQAAQRGISIKSSPELEIILAKGLATTSIFTSESDAKTKLLIAAETAAGAAISESKLPSVEAYTVMGDVLVERGSYSEAEKNYRLALTANEKSPDGDVHATILRGLITCAANLNKQSEAERWFQLLVAISKASIWDWSAEGDRLFSQASYSESEAAYQKSAIGGGGYRQWCLTALSASIMNHDDLVLSAGRKCIEGGVGQKDSEPILADAHKELAEALNRRGVYSEALFQARESLTLKPEDPFAYDDMADALFGLRRFEEVVTAAQQAIRLSDGKYAWMHFRLASAYFELHNWEFARQSFQKAQELNPNLYASVYNVALCYSKLGYYRDAVRWYEEYLRRNPTASDRSEVEATIRTLKSM